MLNLHRLTWILVARGIAALVFGLLAVTLPGVTLGSLILLFAIYALVDGVTAIIGAITHSPHHHDWWLMLLAGVLSSAVGVITLMRPQVTAIVLLIFIAVRALIVGVLEIAYAFGLRRAGGGWVLLLLSGLVSVAFGLVLLATNPIQGAVTIVWVIGVFAIVYGVTQLIMASEVRHLGKQPPVGA
ncbi:MAG: DUF308 domain-containing protein [Planctomycetia bacterium]|nr:DUF308 domain-containing protein [Planctomycetia bacterium]